MRLPQALTALQKESRARAIVHATAVFFPREANGKRLATLSLTGGSALVRNAGKTETRESGSYIYRAITGTIGRPGVGRAYLAGCKETGLVGLVRAPGEEWSGVSACKGLSASAACALAARISLLGGGGNILNWQGREENLWRSGSGRAIRPGQGPSNTEKRIAQFSVFW